MYSAVKAPSVRAIFGRGSVAAITATAFLREHVARERGAAMAEYGLLLALVALVVFAALALFGGALVGLFTDAEAEFSTINNPGSP